MGFQEPPLVKQLFFSSSAHAHLYLVACDVWRAAYVGTEGRTNAQAGLFIQVPVEGSKNKELMSDPFFFSS